MSLVVRGIVTIVVKGIVSVVVRTISDCSDYSETPLEPIVVSHEAVDYSSESEHIVVSHEAPQGPDSPMISKGYTTI